MSELKHIFTISYLTVVFLMMETMLQHVEREENGAQKQRKGLNIDLNLPPPIDYQVEEVLPNMETVVKKKSYAKYYAKQSKSRRERIRSDPAYAKRRREIETKAKKKWRMKKVANLKDEEQEAEKMKRKEFHHQSYLRRISKYNGRTTKGEQEIAELIKRMKRGEKIPLEEEQKVLEYRKRRNQITRAARLRAKLKKNQQLTSPK